MRATACVALFSSACALFTNLDGLAGSTAGDASNEASGACVASSLAGTTNLSALTSDYIAGGALDVIRFTTQAPGVARCAWIYLPTVDSVSTVYLAAYDTDNGGNPSKLLGTATLATPIVGWNNAMLDSPITLDAGEALWIGAVSPKGNLSVLDGTQCDAANGVREDSPVTLPPPTFTQSTTFPPCNMGVYLGP